MKKFFKIVIAVFLILFVLVCLVRCNNRPEYSEWPDSGLCTMLPEPGTKKIVIGYENEDSFKADLMKSSMNDYEVYVDKCKEKGFVVDAEEKTDAYAAYNEDGFRLSLSYYNYNEEISINLTAPKEMEEMDWPTMGLATLIPVPASNMGTIDIDTSSQFNAYIGQTSEEDYRNYVDQCISGGFDVDYSRDEKIYSAYNTNGDSLRVEYQGFNMMYISMYAADEDIDDVADSDADVVSDSDKDVVSDDKNESTGDFDDFKEAMDSYEEFIDEYIAFMEKYANSDDTSSLLTDYANYMAKYAEVMKKLDAIDEDELSEEEALYYAEVSARISQKLAKASLQ